MNSVQSHRIFFFFRVHFGLNPISEIRGDSPVAPVRPVPRIPADPTEYSATERELGIEDDSDDVSVHFYKSLYKIFKLMILNMAILRH